LPAGACPLRPQPRRERLPDRYDSFDTLDSATRLTDNTAQLIDSDVSEAYGQIASMTGSSTNPVRFVGALGYGDDAHPGTYYVRPGGRINRGPPEWSISVSCYDGLWERLDE
jgi:hypothetical protein